MPSGNANNDFPSVTLGLKTNAVTKSFTRNIPRPKNVQK